MQNRTFVTAFSANFYDRLAKFGLTVDGAVKMIVALKLQEFCYCMLHHSFRLCWRKCPSASSFVCLYYLSFLEQGNIVHCLSWRVDN